MATALLPARSRKTISLTALIDVVFILLMFFMLTSSFSQLQALALKSASAVEEVPVKSTDPALLIVDDAGRFYFNSRSAPAQTVKELRADIAADQAVVLLPYSNTSVQVLVDAMQSLKTAGFEQLTLGSSLAAESD